MKNSTTNTRDKRKSWVEDAMPTRYLLRYPDAALFFGVSQSIIERMAKEADAVYHYGKVSWIHVNKILEYIECCNGDM